MSYAYAGKGLQVDLSSGKIEEIYVETEILQKYLGGKGLGIKLLYDRVKEGTDPLSEDNALIFLTGPLTYTITPTAGRLCVVTKSPLTGIHTDGYVGGFFGAKFKSQGIDFLIIRGKADKPVYLLIDDGKVEIKDASDLWGKNIFEVDDILKERHKGVSTAVIGVAGEKLCRFACISFDKGRQAGRCGPGAVMGSKNLKAICVTQGKWRPNLYKKEEFTEYAKNLHKYVETHPTKHKRHIFGTMVCIWEGIESGIIPVRNYSGKFSNRIVETAPEYLLMKGIDKGRTTCFACPIKCTKISEVKKTSYKGKKYEAPEYEPVALLGINCDIYDLDYITSAHIMCNDVGVDAISMGNVAGFAMECVEKGLIKDKDAPRFGDAESLLKFIDLVSKREGIGDLFADGVKRASEKIGGDSYKFAIHVKGLELAGVDPRASWGMAIAFATADRGGCHQRCWTPRAELYGILKENYEQFVKEVQDERCSCFSVVLCDFVPLTPAHVVKLINLATGFDLTEKDYIEMGERIWNLARLFAVREGISRKDDTLPQRFFEEKMEVPQAKPGIIDKEEFEKKLSRYYELRGWDKNGIPTSKKLKQLGL